MVRFDRVESAVFQIVGCSFFEASRAAVTMQAFSIVVGIVKLDLLRDVPEVLDVDVPQAAKLRLESAIQRVVGVACIARLIAGHPIVLKVGGGKVGDIIHEKALAVVLHYVAGRAKRRRLRALHMLVDAH